MLIKLIKHDLMATYRDFIGLYIALLLLSIIGPFVVSTAIEWAMFVVMFGIFGVSVATLVVTFLTIIRLYSRRLFSNEGYLTLTLPVKTRDTIISKVVTGLVWSSLSALVFIIAGTIFVSIMFIVPSVYSSSFDSLSLLFNEIWKTNAIWVYIQSFLVILPSSLLESIYSLILLVFVITLINTSFIKKYKVAIGIVSYILLSLALNSLLGNIHGDLLVFSPITTLDNDFSLELLKQLSFTVNGINYAINFIGYLLYIAGLGYATWWLLENKLEIE